MSLVFGRRGRERRPGPLRPVLLPRAASRGLGTGVLQGLLVPRRARPPLEAGCPTACWSTPRSSTPRRSGRRRRAYNEALPRSETRDSLNVRLDGPDGTRVVWTLADPLDGGGWRWDRTRMIERLLPHVRQFVQVRMALAEAGSLGQSLTGLLDASRTGVIHLDRRGRVAAANDTCRRAAAATRRADRRRRGPARRRARGRRRPAAAVGTRPAALQRARRRGLDDGRTDVGLAAARAARQPRRRAVGGLPHAARRRAGAGRRPGAPALHRSGPRGGGARSDLGAELGGGDVGRRTQPRRDRGGHEPNGGHDPLAPEADLHEAADLTAGGLWCGWCCRRRRRGRCLGVERLPTVLPRKGRTAAGGRRSSAPPCSRGRARDRFARRTSQCAAPAAGPTRGRRRRPRGAPASERR